MGLETKIGEEYGIVKAQSKQPQPTTPASTLASLAMLKVNADHGGQDYSSYLESFVGHTLRPLKGQDITTALVQQKLLSEFGLNLPHHVIERVLKRFADSKHGILNRQYGRFVLVKEPKPDNIEAERRHVMEQQGIVRTALREHVRETYQVEWSDEQAATALLEYLGQFSIDCLRTYESRCALPALHSQQRQDVFFVHSFAQFAQQNQAEMFESLITLVKSHMLANALICEDLSSIQKRFDRVTFYLDTPLTLHFLDLNETAFEAPARELMDMLRNLSGRLCVFDHTFEEIEGVLSFHEQALKKHRGGNRLTDSLRVAGKTSTDLALLRGDLERELNRRGITVQSAPPYSDQSTHEFQLDQSALESAMDDEVRYFNPRAKEHDVRSIRSIYVLRTGIQPREVEECKAILVTSNTGLARTAYEFGKTTASFARVSAVISDFSLANIAWLKSPMQAPDLPRLEVMAACYAAMNPSEKTWARYVAEIDKLLEQGNITEEQHLFFRSQDAQHELAHLTRGSDDAFSPLLAHEVIERVRANAVREVEQREQEKAARQQQEHEQMLQERDSQLQAMNARLEETNAKLETTAGLVEEERAQRERERAERENRLTQRAQKMAKVASWTFFACVAAAITAIAVVATLASQSPKVQLMNINVPKPYIVICIWILAVLGLVGTLCGASVLHWKTQLEQRWTPKCRAFLQRLSM